MKKFILYSMLFATSATAAGLINDSSLSTNAKVKLSKLELVPNNSVVGNVSGSPAVPSVLNQAQLTALLNAFTGDSGSGGVKGLVPAPSAGDTGLGKFLMANGGWSVPPSSGITALTGDVTATGPGSAAATIANNAVTNAKAADMANSTIKCRTTAGTGDPEDCTATQTTALLNAFVGDSGSGGTKGLVPAPSSGDAAALKYLKSDGTWDGPGDSVWLLNANATPNGTTNTRIRNFGKMAISGTSLTAQISGLDVGSYIRVLKKGLYTINYLDSASGGSCEMGLSLNTSSFTTNIRSIHEDQRLANAVTSSADAPKMISYTGIFNVGDSVRAHGDSNCTNTGNGNTYLRMTRIL